MRDQPYPGMGNVSKAEGLYLQAQEAKKGKSKSDKLAIRIKTGLVSERGLAFSLLNDVLHRQKYLDDYRLWWIGDCVAKAVLEDVGLANEEDREDLLSWNVDTLKEWDKTMIILRKAKSSVSKQWYEQHVPGVCLESKEIKQWLGRRKLLNSDIHELVQKFNNFSYERRSKRFTSKDGDRWYEAFSFQGVCKVKGIKTGKYSTRNQQPEYFYWFYFDDASSKDFYDSIRLGFFDCRPQSYYHMKGGSQNILRLIGWLVKPSTLELDQLCRIAGIKTKHKKWKQKYIESYLDELVKAGYLINWNKRIKKLGRKKEIFYTLNKTKYLPTK